MGVVSDVMTRDKPPRSALGVEAHQLLAAATRARDALVGLIGKAAAIVLSVPGAMMSPARHHLDIAGVVVSLHAIDVMRDLARPETPAQFLFSNQPVLIGVAAHVGEVVVPSDTNEHISV